MRSRVVPINKDAPKIGQINRYRPIVVSSPVVKYLEGLLIGKLRDYGLRGLSNKQFGFRGGVGIE